MSKHDSSTDKGAGTEALTTDPDPVQITTTEPDTAESSATGSVSEPVPESESASQLESASEPADESEAKSEPEPEPEPEPKVPQKPRRPWLSLFNFLLILTLAAGAGYYWWQQQQVARDYTAINAELRQQLAELEQQLASKAGNAMIAASLSPLEGDIGSLGRKIDELGFEQQVLRDSSEKLYELFGRDKNDWQLAEVEYLMRVAQHKLILQDDFEGAAITLQAASDKIGLTGDPGLLPVRVMISEEIAELKTRKRPDLVGITLILRQLGREIRVLQPGFAIRIDEIPAAPEAVEVSQDWFDRFIAFIDSLVVVRNEATEPSEIEANSIDVGETLQANLKLARWSVLERDARQYQLLLEQSLRLFREFYDLDNAANNDFMTQLQDLQKMVLKPEKPDITGSLYELQRILSQRENAPPEPVATETIESEPDATETMEPEPAATETTEPGNG
jgi:uroporphyrin-3 C-methyltransferase